MAEVQLDRVRKVYPNGVEAVHGLTLTIPDRQFIVLVGPSGCGKSTTLRMIAGLEEITDGEIRIGRRVVNDVAPKHRDIAMVFQNYALYPHMTAYRNMAFGLKLRKVPRREIDQRVRRAAEVLGIADLLDRRPRELSGGQRQRVAVGRAIVRDPKCFLFDEPLSNLDAKLRVEMRAELKRLHLRLQTTTVYVTHDQEEAMTLGDRVVVLRDGYVMQVGGPLEVYRRPANRFVAGFLGTPPMNFLDGRIAAEDGRLWFDDGAQRLAVPAWASETLADAVGQPVTLGIRPEAFGEGAEAEDGSGGLAVTVRVVEPLGEKMDVYVSAPRQEGLVARLPARPDLAPGDRLVLLPHPDRLHFFAPEDPDAGPAASGENLCLDAERARDGEPAESYGGPARECTTEPRTGQQG